MNAVYKIKKPLYQLVCSLKELKRPPTHKQTNKSQNLIDFMKKSHEIQF